MSESIQEEQDEDFTCEFCGGNGVIDTDWQISKLGNITGGTLECPACINGVDERAREALDK